MSAEFIEKHTDKFYELVSQHNEALVAELAKVGVDVQSISFLGAVGRPPLTDEAIDLLTKRLFERNYFHPRVEDGFRAAIARSLDVKGSLKYFDEYVREYEQEPNVEAYSGYSSSAKDGLASLIASLCRIDKKRLPDLLKLARNKENGDTRAYFIYALYKMGYNEYLQEFLNDPELQLAAQNYLDTRRKNSEKRAKHKKAI